MEEPNELPDPQSDLSAPHDAPSVPSAAPAAPRAFPTRGELLAILGVFLGTNILAGLAVMAFGGGKLTGLGTFLCYVATLGVTIAFAWRMMRVRTGTTKGLIRLNFKGLNPTMILWGVILMLAANVVIEPLINFFPPEWYALVGEQITSGGWAMFTAIVMAPLCEEILFRGIIQQSLTRKRGPVTGILIASAIFGISHGIPQQVVAGFCLGIVIGFVYHKTGSLLAAMVLHLINNALATITTLFESEENAGATLRQMMGHEGLYWGVYAFCAVLLIVSLVQVVRKSERGNS